MTDFDWRPLVVVIDPAEPDWAGRLSAALPADAHADKKIAVSFFDGAVGRCASGNWHPIRHWRDLVPPNLHESLYSDSYVDIKALLMALPSDYQCWLSCNLHVLADALTRYRAMDYLAERVRPELVILPCGSELTYRFASMVHAHGLSNRLVGGGRNALRIRHWILDKKKALEGNNAPVKTSAISLSGVVMIVEDGVSAVHLEPALAVAAELTRLNFTPRILTSSPEIAAIVFNRGYSVHEIQPKSLAGFAYTLAVKSPLPWYRLWRSLRIASPVNQAVGPYFMAWLRGKLMSFVTKRMLMLEDLERMEKQRPVEAILTLGETFPLVITALAWARHCRIPDAAFTPVLIGGRPDNEDFPATLHLVYGEQGAECMVSQKVRRESIEVVGSPAYDNSLGRDREADTRAIRQLLPAWQLGQQLLVVATEALPNPDKELIPILRASASLGNLHTVIKIHPADSRLAIEAIVSDLKLTGRVDILMACDLLALLHSADLLVCNFSNIAVSAAILGTPTMVPVFTRRSRPVDFIAEGFASACDDLSRLPIQIQELATPGAVREAALDRMRKALHRFAGLADGNSHARISKTMIRLVKLNYKDQ